MKADQHLLPIRFLIQDGEILFVDKMQSLFQMLMPKVIIHKLT